MILTSGNDKTRETRAGLRWGRAGGREGPQAEGGPLEQTPDLSGRVHTPICVVTEKAGCRVVRKSREEADSSWGRKIIINDGFY